MIKKISLYWFAMRVIVHARREGNDQLLGSVIREEVNKRFKNR
jgi:hypothetical protein